MDDKKPHGGKNRFSASIIMRSGKLVRVRCLSCDHWFWSKDRCRQRICKRCQDSAEKFGRLAERAFPVRGLDTSGGEPDSPSSP